MDGLDIGKEAVDAELARQERHRQNVAAEKVAWERERLAREKRRVRHDKMFPDCEGGFDCYGCCC